MSRPPAEPEREVLAQCLDALRMLGLDPERQNTGAVQAERGGGTRTIRFNKKGSADIKITALPDGRGCEIEVKRKGKRPTREQMERLRSINASNGVGFWVNDSEQVLRVMPHILRGSWIEIDEAGNCFVTDEPKGTE